MSNLFFSFFWFLSIFTILGLGCISAGSVRKSNSLLQLSLTISVFSLSALILWTVGFSLMYNEVNKYIGKPELGPFINLLSLDYIKTPINSSFSNTAFFLYQIILSSIIPLIVMGTIAERVKPASFIILSFFLILVIYPIYVAWTWGGGWLHSLGFIDTTGATTVCILGGWSALVASIAIGPRINRFSISNNLKKNITGQTSFIGIGSIFIILGWLGINNMPNILLHDNLNISYSNLVFLNTLLAGSSAVFISILICMFTTQKLELRKIINSSIIGVISISADPLSPSHEIALIIGSVAGIIFHIGSYIIDKIKIDDATYNIPVFLLGGIWSAIAVCISNKHLDILIQLAGITAAAVISIIGTSILWIMLKHTFGIRPKYDEEIRGYEDT